MTELRLDQTCRMMGGTILQGAPSQSFQRFNIDSRLTEPGELFFALVSDRDGHEFIPDAAARGASGAVISLEIKPPNSRFALVSVKNTLTALQELARKVLAEQDARVIGITGSAGKTTTKEFTAALLSKHYRVLKSKGNFNNHIGLPLSLLELHPSHNAVVLEMGMSAPGEIEVLTRISPPDIAVITNVHPVHLEFFDGIEQIALAKKEILTGMKPEGVAVLNGDNLLLRKIAQEFKGKVLFFGLGEQCPIRAREIRRSGLHGLSFQLVYGSERMRIMLPFFAESTLYNFLAAAAVAYIMGVPLPDIPALTAELKPFSHRGEILRLKSNIIVVDDSYNSNPAALESALKSLPKPMSGRKVAVLGDMLELGPKAIDFHKRAGKQVAACGFDLLITVGPLSKHMAEAARKAGMKPGQVHMYKDGEEAAHKIWLLLDPGDLVLVKGSHGIKTDRIVTQLKKKGY